MKTTYSDYQQALAPVWLQGPIGRAWQQTLGEIKDELLQRACEAVAARWASSAPLDALLRLASDHSLSFSVGIDSTTLRDLLVHAWTHWKQAGTAEVILQALHQAGFRNASLRESSQWKLPHWCFFYIVLKPPFPWGEKEPNSTIAKALFARIKTLKPAHAHLEAIIVVHEGMLWGDRPPWSKPTRWGAGVTYWKEAE